MLPYILRGSRDYFAEASTFQRGESSRCLFLQKSSPPDDSVNLSGGPISLLLLILLMASFSSSANEEERERRAHIILFGQRTEQQQAREKRRKRLIARPSFFFSGHPRILFPDFLNHFSRRENFALGGGREEWKGGENWGNRVSSPRKLGCICDARNFSFFLPTVVRKVPTALSCRDWYVETFYLPAAGKKSDRKREKKRK